MGLKGGCGGTIMVMEGCGGYGGPQIGINWFGWV